LAQDGDDLAGDFALPPTEWFATNNGALDGIQGTGL